MSPYPCDIRRAVEGRADARVGLGAADDHSPDSRPYSTVSSVVSSKESPKFFSTSGSVSSGASSETIRQSSLPLASPSSERCTQTTPGELRRAAEKHAGLAVGPAADATSIRLGPIASSSTPVERLHPPRQFDRPLALGAVLRALLSSDQPDPAKQRHQRCSVADTRLVGSANAIRALACSLPTGVKVNAAPRRCRSLHSDPEQARARSRSPDASAGH